MSRGDPLFYTVRTGFACNNKCIHCFVEKKKSVEDLSEEVLRTTIDEAPKGSIVSFTGGEPTIRPDFIRLLKYASDKGHITNLQSNGIKFAEEDFTKQVVPYLQSITFPIHSSDAKIFDIVTGIPGSFEPTIEGFKNLVKSKVIMMTQTVINQYNYKTLLDTFDMIQILAPGAGMTLTFPHPVGAAHTTEVVPKLSEVAEYITPVLKKYGYLMHTHYIPRCYLYPYQDIVSNVDREDMGDTWKPGTDFTVNGWEKVDYGAYRKDMKVKAENCQECVFNSECIGVWAEYGELYPNLDFNPIKVSKEEIAANKKLFEKEIIESSVETPFYRLKDMSSPLIFKRIEGFKQVVIDRATGEIIEHPYSFADAGELVSDEMMELISSTGASPDMSTISIIDGKVNGYSLVYPDPGAYTLSPIDKYLQYAVDQIMVRIKDDAISTWYICRDASENTIRMFFADRGAIDEYKNLMMELQATGLSSCILSPDFDKDSVCAMLFR
jgi:MoaA/NifB/PqqE/SkfB family radical SAM enzyme